MYISTDLEVIFAADEGSFREHLFFQRSKQENKDLSTAILDT